MRHAAVLLILFGFGIVQGADCPAPRLQDADLWAGRPADELVRECGRPDGKRRADRLKVLVYKLRVYLPDDAGPFSTGETELWVGGSTLPDSSSPVHGALFYAPVSGKVGSRVAGIQRVEITVADGVVRDVETRPVAWKRRIRRQMKRP